jgi:hypothetical protein
MMNRYVAGAAGGLLATLPMTIGMEAPFRRLPATQQHPLPPRELVDAVADGAAKRHDSGRAYTSLAAHFGYGMLTGALYPLAGRGRLRRHPVLVGSTFGVGIWAASYLGWAPAAGLLAPATRHPRQRRWLMIAVHLVWGAVTGLICRRLSGDPSDLGGSRGADHGLPQRPRDLRFARRERDASAHDLGA